MRLTCQSGMRAALLDALNSYTDGLAEEPGTEVFVVSLDPESPDLVWLYEIFRDEESEHAHRASQGFAALMQSIPPMLAGPPAVLRMEPLRLSLQEHMLQEDWAF